MLVEPGGVLPRHLRTMSSGSPLICSRMVRWVCGQVESQVQSASSRCSPRRSARTGRTTTGPSTAQNQKLRANTSAGSASHRAPAMFHFDSWSMWSRRSRPATQPIPPSDRYIFRSGCGCRHRVQPVHRRAVIAWAKNSTPARRAGRRRWSTARSPTTRCAGSPRCRCPQAASSGLNTRSGWLAGPAARGSALNVTARESAFGVLVDHLRADLGIQHNGSWHGMMRSGRPQQASMCQPFQDFPHRAIARSRVGG